jgi:hypothetical protein
MSKHRSVSGRVSISRLKHHVIRRIRGQSGVLVRKLAWVEPDQISIGRRLQMKPRLYRLLVDVVVERDPYRRRSRDVDGPAYRRVIDDLRRVAAARADGAQYEEGDDERSS